MHRGHRGLLASGAVLVAVAAGACDSGYDVTLSVSDQINTVCTTSCVGSVGVLAIGNGDSPSKCISGVSMKSLRDHGLQGKFDLRVPDEFSGIWITGYRGQDCRDMAIFDGIAGVTGSEIKVPIDCVASCKDMATITVKTTNIIAAMQGRCEVGTATAVASGTLRSDRWDEVSPAPASSEFTGGAPVVLAAGNATLPGATLLVGMERACAAVATFTNGAPSTLACVRGYRGLCLNPATDAGKIEVPTYPAQPVAPTPSGEVRSIALFAERDIATMTPRPLAGATVALDPLSPPARIEYTDLTIDQNGAAVLSPRAGTSTGPSGSFAVYSSEPVSVTITHNGKQYRRQIGGGVIYGEVSSSLVAGAQIITPE